MVKEIRKNIGNKIIKKKVLGLTEIKFCFLCFEKSKNTGTKRVSLIYWERVTSSVSEIHALDSGPELDLPFLFIRECNGRFVNRPDFWFTFPYHPNVGPILDRFAGFFHTPV